MTFHASPIALSAGLALLILPACRSVGPDYKRPEVPHAPADAYREAGGKQAASAVLPAQWWKIFGDPELDALVEQGMKANQDLAGAVAAVRAARAQAGIADAGSWPTVSANPSVDRSRTSGTVNAPSTTRTTWTIPLNASYEVDVWGRVRRMEESSAQSLKATEADLAVVRQAVQADIATTYFNLRGFDVQAQIYAKALELLERELALAEKQYQAGLVQKTDVLAAQTLLESTRTQLIETRRQRANAQHALATLTGRTAAELALPERTALTEVPQVPAGLPSQLLERRPDVWAAERRLAAANANIGVAAGNKYPQFMLTGSAGFQTVDAQRVVDWQSRIWSLTPSVNIPLFTGGRLDAQMEAAKAEYDASLAAFRKSILEACREVEDGVNDLGQRAQGAASQERTLASARENVRLAEKQYQTGLSNYTTVLSAATALLSNELSASQIQTQRLVSSVTLMKALGGGWGAPAGDPKKDAAQPPAIK